MDAILTLTKPFALDIMLKLADSGEEARAKKALRRYHEDENPETLAAAYAALAGLGETRLREIKTLLGGHGRSQKS